MAETRKPMRLHAYLSGRVQGVGMRATVLHLAHAQGLTGWVRNLPDRRVELTAEGDAEALTTFVNQLRSTMGTFIRDMDEQYGAATGEWSGFEVVF